MRANGLNAHTSYLVQLVSGTGNINTVRVFETIATSDASGTLRQAIVVDQAPGAYTVRIVTRDGTMLATTPFTVAAGDSSREQCFAETGFCVGGRFLEYWEGHGLDLGDPGVSYRESLALLGYPISAVLEQRLEDGNTYRVQYFERVRLEYHPENAAPYDVLLGQFGRHIHPADPPVDPQDGAIYFFETGHNVNDLFMAYWEANGGLAQFGYPISEQLVERLEDGELYKVQYFERARFEFHWENTTPYDILLGHFGRQILAETVGGR